MKIDIIEVILKTVTIFFALIALYMIILKIIGKSPTLSHVNTSLIIMVISILITFSYKLITFSYKYGKFEGEMKEFKRLSLDAFSKIREDLTKIKNKLKV